MLLRAGLGLLMMTGCFDLAACQTPAPRTPAALAAADAASLAQLKAALAEALGVAQVELGPGDLTQTSRVSVLPPPLGPLEGRSPALPTQFEIVIEGGACFAVRQDTGEAVELAGLACRPLSPAP